MLAMTELPPEERTDPMAAVFPKVPPESGSIDRRWLGEVAVAAAAAAAAVPSAVVVVAVAGYLFLLFLLFSLLQLLL